jgi:hypothetical protein
VCRAGRSNNTRFMETVKIAATTRQMRLDFAGLRIRGLLACGSSSAHVSPGSLRQASLRSGDSGPRTSDSSRYRPSVNSTETAAVIAGSFALGGVLIGWIPSWLQSVHASRRAATSERDAVFVDLTTNSYELMREMGTLRQRHAGRVGKGNTAELLSLMTSDPRAITLASVRLSVLDDELADATVQLAHAVEVLLTRAWEPSIADEQAGLVHAIVQLEQARNLSATSRWRWRKRSSLRQKLEASRENASV